MYTFDCKFAFIKSFSFCKVNLSRLNISMAVLTALLDVFVLFILCGNI